MALPIEEQEYYHGLLDRLDVPYILIENGDFLVRLTEPQPDMPRIFVISVMLDKTLTETDQRIRHYTVRESRINEIQMFSLTQDGPFLPSIPLLIDDYVLKETPINAVHSETKAVFRRGIGRQIWELKHCEITLGEKLGEGAFGEVMKGMLNARNMQIDVAIKVMKNLADAGAKEKMQEMMKEARLMRGFDHPNVVRLYGVVVEFEPLYIVMEFVTDGALSSYLRKYVGTVNNISKNNMIMGAAWGIHYLHLMNVLHRDIACRNCLYSNGNVKISDFGLSKVGASYQMTTPEKLPAKWMAPETLETGIFTQKTDVYAFGILVWEIYADGADPYPGLKVDEIRTKIPEGHRMIFSPEAPPEVTKMVVDRCWGGKPESRWTMQRICKRMEKITGNKTPPQNIPPKNELTSTRDRDHEEVDEGDDSGAGRTARAKRKPKPRKKATKQKGTLRQRLSKDNGTTMGATTTDDKVKPRKRATRDTEDTDRTTPTATTPSTTHLDEDPHTTGTPTMGTPTTTRQSKRKPRKKATKDGGGPRKKPSRDVTARKKLTRDQATVDSKEGVTVRKNPSREVNPRKAPSRDEVTTQTNRVRTRNMLDDDYAIAPRARKKKTKKV